MKLQEYTMNQNNKSASQKKEWSQPTLKTFTLEELKKIITVSACSQFIDMCPRGFFR